MAKFSQQFLKSMSSPGLFEMGVANLGDKLSDMRLRQRQTRESENIQQILQANINNPAKLQQLAQEYQIKGNAAAAAAFQDAANRVTAKDTAGKDRGIQGGLMAITQGSLRNIPLADPKGGEDLQAAVRSVLALGGTQEQIMAAYEAGQEKKEDEDFRKSDEVTIRDSKGNKFITYSIQDINQPNSQPVVKYVPVGKGPDKPVGKITIISDTTGAGAFDKPGIAGDVRTEQEFANLKVDATAQLPELMSQSRILDDAVAALGTMESQGLPEVVVNTIRSEFGVQDPDIAEYEMLVGELMFSRLKPLFGGVISEGEREAIMGLYNNMKRGDPANRRILMQLQKKVKETIVKANLIRRADSFDDYNMSLDRMYPAEEENTEQNVIDYSTLPTQG